MYYINDESIHYQDSASEALLGVQAKVEEVEKIVNERIAIHKRLIEAVSTFKGDKEEETLKNTRYCFDRY